MNLKIVSSSESVTLLGGGRASEQDVSTALAFAPRLVAADGGAKLAFEAGLVPEAVIGDLDSLHPELRQAMPEDHVFHIAEQDTTDFDKAVRNIDAPLVIGVGFTGARIDHELASLNLLARRADRRIVLISETEVIWALPRRLRLNLPAREIFSLMPFRPVTGQSEGLQWPIAGIDFAPGGRIGTSNATTGPVSLLMDGPGMLALMPRVHLGLLVDALLALPPDALWPARA